VTQPIDLGTGVEPVDRRCSARSSRTGERCKRWAVKGAKVCPAHGARAPQVKAAAKRRRDEQTALAAVATYGLPRQIAPDQALLEEVHRTAGHVAWLHQLIGGLDQTGLTQRAENGTTSPAVWVDLYQRERAHLVKVAASAIAAGIAERQVKLAEQQGALLASAVQRILDALDLTPQQRARVPEVVPVVLRQIEQGAA
jgi:hypothetical protein